MSKPIESVGERITTEAYSHLHEGELRSFYTPKVKVNSKMVYIRCSESVSGIKEFFDRESARECARSYKEDVKTRLLNK